VRVLGALGGHCEAAIELRIEVGQRRVDRLEARQPQQPNLLSLTASIEPIQDHLKEAIW
jgi:hypothetical protein